MNMTFSANPTPTSAPTTLDPLWIALIVIGIILVLGLGVLLYFTVFAHERMKSQVKAISKSFEMSHALLIGNVSQHVVRLEQIADFNIAFGSDAALWRSRYADLASDAVSSCQAKVRYLNELSETKRWSALKRELPETKKEVESLTSRINAAWDAISEKFKIEEEANVLLMQTRERVRKLKAGIEEKKSDLDILSETFDRLFKLMDTLLSDAENSITRGDYQNAADILKEKLGTPLGKLEETFPSLPEMSLEITTILPEKLSSLKAYYQGLLDEKYPLHHVLEISDIKSMEGQLAALRSNISGLELRGVQNAIDLLEKRMALIRSDLDKEVSARAAYELGNENAYQLEREISADYIKLCHSLPNVRSIYLIDEEDEKKILEIQNLVNRAGAAKRSLDTYVHSSFQTPYSTLLAKMKELQDLSTEAKGAFLSFRDYLQLLKAEADKESEIVDSYYEKLKEAETVLESIGIEKVESSYKEDIDTLYADIDALYSLIKTMPIDVKKGQEIASSIVERGDYVFSSIDKKAELAQKAEKAIVLMNKERANDETLNASISQAETLFLEGEFARALDILGK